MAWIETTLGDSRYFEIIPSGIDQFKGNKDYLSTESVQFDKIQKVEDQILFNKRPARANMQPRFKSTWFAKMKNTIKVYTFDEANQSEVDKYILSTGFSGIKSTVCLPKYLKYYFLSSSFNLMKDQFAIGTTQSAINNEGIKKIPISFPESKEEQELIINEIEKQISRLERVVNLLTNSKIKVELYRKSLLNYIYDSVSDKNSWMPLMKLCDKIQDGSHFSPQVQYPEKRNDTYMYVTAKNIRKKGMDLKNLTYVDKSFFESIYSRCDPKKGDLLLTKDGVNTGDCAINELDDPFALLSSVAIIRGKEGVLDNKFVKYYIDSPRGFNKITGKMTGTAIKRIILRRIKEAEIPYLQINEQKRIVNEIEAKFSIIDILEGNIQKCLIKARLLRMSLLKSAFDGKLVGGLNDRS